jgi:hypothetical protein
MKRRRAHGWFLLAGLSMALASLAGCQSGSTGSYKRSAARPVEPGLATSGDPAEPGVIVEKPLPPPRAAWVERHPLFSKPREVYDNAGSNKVVKVAGATIVGIPMGIAAELKQIVVGTPTSQRNL